jgi:hypothetical protein
VTIAPKSSVTNNAQHATNYLISKGWSKEQAAGLVGNFQQESTINLNTSLTGDGGKAYGIAQWHPDRQANFQKQYGFPIQQANLDQQLDFVNYELTKGTEQPAGNKLKTATTAADAALIVSKSYERPSILAAANDKRIAYANALAGGAPLSTTPRPALTPAEIDRISRPSTGLGIDQFSKQEPYDPNTDFYKAVAGDSPQVKDQLTSETPDAAALKNPLPNLLHQFPSYIYGLSLHLLTPAEYNTVSSGGNYVPNRVLIASAGRYKNTPGVSQFIRSPYFSEDFYFENLNINTVIGTNSNSRNTNSIELSFNLIEPYGMTLINRLLDQANDPVMECSNYLEMIYMIQIDFFASNDAGEIVGIVPGITKHIPVKITQMGITTNVGGSKYAIQAVPYNHSAFDQSTISTPANFEVVAGSVAEFFQAGASTNPQSQVTSFPSALNGWQTGLAKNNKIGAPDSYSFNIDPLIANSAFVSAGSMSAKDTSMANPNNTNSIRQSNTGQATKDFNAQTRTFSINAGTSIDKVIDNVMRQSSYIQDQIAIPDGVDPQTYLQQKSANSNKPLNWYKIVPTVTVGAFDPIRKVYSRNITYNVQPYAIYNVKSDVAPQGKIKSFVKEYNYIYTGKNDDIINFDINFNTLYYTAQTAYRNSVTNISTAPDPTAGKNSGSYQGATQAANSVMPMVMKPQVYNAKSRATGGIVTAKQVAVADLEDSLMTLSAADMLSIQLTIIGDPQFIKQDDAFYSPQVVMASADPRLTPNGSLRTDYQEIYVKVLFRTPIDIDETTGMMDFGSNYRTSVFSGLYKVLTVISEFKNGQFTQTLDLIRIPYQPSYDYVTQQKSNDTNQRGTDINSSTVAALDTSLNVRNVPIPTQIASADDIGLNSGLVNQLTTAVDKNVNTLQQNLIDINKTIPTSPITPSTEPVAVPYIPGQ